MRRGSSKPCPGCGEVKSWRPAKEVCTDCKRLLKRAVWLEEQLSKLDDDEVIVAFAERAYWNEYIYSHSGVGRNLMDIFHRLAKSGSRPSPRGNAEFNLLGKIESFGGTNAIMPRPLAEAIAWLRDAVADALKKEYEEGKRDGHRLMMRLANGDLSMNDFDKETRKG